MGVSKWKQYPNNKILIKMGTGQVYSSIKFYNIFLCNYLKSNFFYAFLPTVVLVYLQTEIWILKWSLSASSGLQPLIYHNFFVAIMTLITITKEVTVLGDVFYESSLEFPERGQFV